MFSLPSPRAPNGGSLRERLHKLRGALDGLRDQLREGVAHAIGGVIADAVRDLIRKLLTDAQHRPNPLPVRPMPPSSASNSSLWDTLEDCPEEPRWPEETE